MDATSSNPDPFEALIADGRVGVRPSIPYKDATILTINYQLLQNKIQSLLLGAYLDHEPLRESYHAGGAPDTIITNRMISNDIACLTRYAILCLYHRLRTVAEFYCPFAATTRMIDDVAPHINPRMEFPSFLSSLLSSIGALRISYGAPRDVLVVYAPPVDAGHIISLIHDKQQKQGSHDRLITNLRLCGVGLSSVDYNHLEGAFWTTCFLSGTGLLKVAGTVHPNNYDVNEDVVRSLALLDPKGQHPFEGIVGLTIGYTNNAAVVAAVAGDIPPGVPAANRVAPRLVGWTYNVSEFGIQPSNPPGVYIVGRGGMTVYTCILAQHLSPGEIASVLRYRLLAPPELTMSGLTMSEK